MSENTEGDQDMVTFNFSGDVLTDEFADVWRYYGESNNVCPGDIRRLCDTANGDDITIYINSDGGTLIAGTEIYSILREYTGSITAHIQSRAASSATVAMMACDRIIAEPVSLVLIHNPSTYVEGDANELRMTAEELDTVKNAIMSAYLGRTKKSREEISAIMDKDIWMDAQTAKDNGLIDEVLTSSSGVRDIVNSIGRVRYPTQRMIETYRAAKTDETNRIAAAKAFLENYR